MDRDQRAGTDDPGPGNQGENGAGLRGAGSGGAGSGDAGPVWGSLRPVSGAPARGEVTHQLIGTAGLQVRQVLSGDLGGPVDYREPEDEWALVVEGRASLSVDGETRQLGPGDWVWLPAGTPHRLLSTAPGTNWVTVHRPAQPPPLPPPGG